eukprot:TRINITY_DN27367_c0_g1_i1.p1 TRINITY_DN27367_c0_g1~~TRINITY_DN27367_c0_g1_i1.p1  ORF type:complete len:560 (+),score=105.63 TRINITY_DN27367_c0_g1_i1:103-1680(+)
MILKEERKDLGLDPTRSIWWEIQDAFGPEKRGRPPKDDLPDEEHTETLKRLKNLVLATEEAVQNQEKGVDISPDIEMLEKQANSLAELGGRDRVKKILRDGLGFVEVEEGGAKVWKNTTKKRRNIQATKHFVSFKLGETAEKASDNFMAMLPPSEGKQEPFGALVDIDIDELINQIRRKRIAPTFEQMMTIVQRARDILEEEENIQCIDPPCTVVGDIHGQFNDLNHKILGGSEDCSERDPAQHRYVFLGDFVDRGENSLLCMALILLYKLKNKDNIIILRGNHESRITNTIYGFHEECRQKYPHNNAEKTSSYSGKPDSEVWTRFNGLFDALPLAALIGGGEKPDGTETPSIFCCHGGLSPDVQYLYQILSFNRFQDIMPKGLMADLTWSDPGTQLGYRPNVRGSGYLFGQDKTDEFCRENGVELVCRAHQCVKDGYKYDQDMKVVTVFSAPNYCWAANQGAILLLNEDMNREFYRYGATEVPEVTDPEPISDTPNNVYFKEVEDEKEDEKEEKEEEEQEDDEK